MDRKKIVISIILCFLGLSLSYSANYEDDDLTVVLRSFSNGFYGASVYLLEEFLKDYPQSDKIPLAKITLAKSFYHKKEYLKAIFCLKELDPAGCVDFADEVYYWLAKSSFAIESYQDVIKFALKTVDDYPDSILFWEAYYLIARSHAETNNLPAAEDIFKKIVFSSGGTNIKERACLDLIELYYSRKKYSDIKLLVSYYLENNPGGGLLDRAYFYRGECFYHELEYAKAVLEYKKALNLTNDERFRDSIYQGMGLSYLSKGDYDEARSSFDNIKGEEGRLLSRGIYYFKTEDYSKALRAIDMFLEKFPKSRKAPLVYLYKAESLYHTGRVNDALCAYRRVVDNFDQYSYSSIINNAYYGIAWCYLKRGDYKKAIRIFANTARNTDDPTVWISSKIQIADVYREANYLDEALVLYEEILKKYPHNIYYDYIQFHVAMIFLNRGIWDEAVSILLKLREDFPRSGLIPEISYYINTIYLGKKDFSRAEEGLFEFILKYPEHSLSDQAKYLYAKTLLNQRKYRQVFLFYNKEIPGIKEAQIKQLMFLDKIKACFDSDEYSKAEDAAKIFIKDFPDSAKLPAVYLLLAKIYENRNIFLKAEHFYNLIIREYPDNEVFSDAVISLGYLFKEVKDFERAVVYFKKAIDADFDSFNLRFALGFCLEKLKSFREALEEYSDIARDSPEVDDKVRAYFRMARIKERRDSIEEAKNIYRKIIKLGSEEAKIARKKLQELETAD